VAIPGYGVDGDGVADLDVDQELSVYQVQREQVSPCASCVRLYVREGLGLGLG
jgi:hypothetical protein